MSEQDKPDPARYDFVTLASRSGARRLAHQMVEEFIPKPTPMPKWTKADIRKIEEATVKELRKAKLRAIKPERPNCSKTKKNGVKCSAKVLLDVEGKPRDCCVDHRPQVEWLKPDEIEYWADQLYAADDPVAWFIEQIGWGQARYRHQQVKKETKP